MIYIIHIKEMLEYIIVLNLYKLRRVAPDSVGSKVVKFYKMKRVQFV
jgi:hypothetical protein